MWRLRSLITDLDGMVSIGRLSYWLVFALMTFHWLRGTSPDDTLMTAFMTLLAYEVLKKGRDLIAFKNGSIEIGGSNE